jgi:hypothetical protein
MWNPFNVIMYWWYFLKEMRLIVKCYRIVKSIEPDLYEQGLRIDWIGRIYAVIQLEDEELKQPEILQQSIVIQSLAPITQILVKYGLSDVMYPEIVKVGDGGSYLIILWPDREYFEFGPFLTAVLATGIWTTAIWAIIHYLPLFSLQNNWIPVFS